MSTIRGVRSRALDAIAYRFQAAPHAIAYDNYDVYVGVGDQGNKKDENFSITSGLMHPIQEEHAGYSSPISTMISS